MNCIPGTAIPSNGPTTTQVSAPSKHATTVDLIPHMNKSRPPDAILDTYSHFIGESATSRIRTGLWANMRSWYEDNIQHSPTAYAVVYEE